MAHVLSLRDDYTVTTFADWRGRRIAPSRRGGFWRFLLFMMAALVARQRTMAVLVCRRCGTGFCVSTPAVRTVCWTARRRVRRLA